MATIVVGSDGSKNGEVALRWAMAEARLRGAELELVHGCLSSSVSLDVTGMALASGREAGEEVLARDLALVRDEAPEVSARTSLVVLSPAEALVEASKHAELVVVGSRGRGELAGLVLGSVSSHVVHHAHCSVVVVRS